MGDITPRAELNIVYNKSGETDELTKDCESWSYTDNATGTADTISLNLQNQDKRWLNNYYPYPEDEIEATIQVVAWYAGGKAGEHKCGKFYIDSYEASGLPNNASLKGISLPINQDFSVTTKTKTWKKTTLRQIATDISTAAGITLQYDGPEISIEEESQSGQTDMTFLFKLAESNGLAMKVYNDQLIIYDLTTYEEQLPRHEIDLGELYTYRFQTKILNVYDAVEMQYTSGKKKKTYTYKYTLEGESGTRVLSVNTKADSVGDAEVKAKAELRKSMREACTMSFTCQGNPDYYATDVFTLTGAGQLDGNYFIDSVTHAKSDKYTCQVNAHRVIQSF